ncbi:MAG: altronate dehydratase [Candidatus Latescibacteria bacterium]|nr:altronate dehydratase [Candidatus Latescibacterota bacterium]
MAAYTLTEKAIILRHGDDVAVLKEGLAEGTELQFNGKTIRLLQDIPQGHKVALNPVAHDHPIRKYGQVFGFASENIPAGAHVHTHNVAIRDFDRDYAYATEVKPVETYPSEQMRDFMGYKRLDGRVGTRNYVLVVSTVNCSAGVSNYVAERFKNGGLRDYPNVDGVVAITHKGGCGTKWEGADFHILQRTLAGFAQHPNVAAYVVIGLGCEVNQAVSLVENYQMIELYDPKQRPPVLHIQESGGITKTVEAGVNAVASLLSRANDVRRTKQPISEILLGAKCGGSDGNSGITANPALGVAADELVRYGGTVVIGETTEMYGAEHLLTRRARNEAVGKKLVERIRWWEWYTKTLGAEINANPAPGNIAGGLTNIYEKSLGAIAKGGTTPLNAVYQYAERMTEHGFVIMDTPGFDPVTITGMVAGGANVVVFTTGRGSVFGCKPTPSIKVTTNSRIYHHMIEDMDFNAGTILEGESVRDVGLRLLDEIIEVASGKKTKSELHGMGDEEFCPWPVGPTV